MVDMITSIIPFLFVSCHALTMQHASPQKLGHDHQMKTTPTNTPTSALRVQSSTHVGVNDSEKPLVVMFRLESEAAEFYVSRTMDSLKQHQYEFKIVNAVDGVRLGNTGVRDMTNTTFKNLSPQEEGCWASHIMAWKMFETFRRPIVSLEADTTAVQEWTVDPSVFADYDILFLHSHDSQHKSCDSSKGTYVTAGLHTWYATGSLLFTGRRPDLVMRELGKEIDLPIGHWLNLMFRTKRLNVGALCPAHFHQNEDHRSTVQKRPRLARR